MRLVDRLRAALGKQGLLVLEVGPRGTRTTVWMRGGPQAGPASSAATPGWTLRAQDAHPACAPAQALPALLARLRGQGVQVPRQCVLLHAGVVLAVAELPVDPARPRPVQQMLDMVRYECEPALAAHNGLWTVGEVLATQGALSPEQRRRIADTLRQGLVNEFGNALRFGEVGMGNEGLVQPQLDAALAAQHELQALDAQVACGWLGRQVRDGHGQRAPVWWMAAASATLRQRWLTSLKEQGLQTRGIWPRAGLAAARAVDSANGTALVLEVWPEQMLALRFVDGRCAGWHQEARQELPADPQVLAEMIAAWQVEPISSVGLLVADDAVDAAGLALDLQHLVRVEVQVLAVDEEAVIERAARAALAEAMTSPAERQVPTLLLRDPRPAWWRQPALRPWLMLAGAAVVLLGWQGLEWRKIYTMQAERLRLQASLSRQADSAQEAQGLSDEARELDRQASELRRDLALALERADSMAAIADRLDEVPALIRSLGSVVDPRVVLDGVVESVDRDIRLGLEVRAWSTDAALLHDYAARVADAVRPLGLTVAQVEVQARPGRLGGPGHGGRFWLVPEMAELQLPSAAAASRPAASSPASQLAASAPRQPDDRAAKAASTP